MNINGQRLSEPMLKAYKIVWIQQYEIYARKLLKDQLGIDDSQVNNYIDNMSYSVCRE